MSHRAETSDAQEKLDAIDRIQAVIEFDAEGTILDANASFLDVMGYQRSQVVGQHHRMFVDAAYADSEAYRAFWAELRSGTPLVDQFKRFANGGREVWIQAAYTPLFDDHGRVRRVIKFATDITAQKLESLDFEGKMAAIDRSQAVIEFHADGTIISANGNFLATMGYTLDEIRGQHHRMFVDAEYRRSPEYADFLKELKQGKPFVGEFKRRHKSGRDVWIQATYNPIVDGEGRVIKVVKFASDITEQKLKSADFECKMAAIDKVQAVIEFKPDGTIITANQNFLSAMGYGLEEIRGQHHRMFVEPSYAASKEYKSLWQRLQGGEAIIDEFERISKDGRRVWISASYNPIFDADRKVIKVVKFATDVTERVLALKETARVTAAVAAGDLTEMIEGDFRGPFAVLRESVNASTRNLGDMVSRIRGSLTAITGAVSEIQRGNSDLNERTQSQAAALEETAASVEEITGSIRQNAENAKQANQLTTDAQGVAAKGQQVVGRAVQSMNDISRSSRKISDIIGVIDEIAFQTNLLALNAAVEAARAGEQGRGFAVVATEVRNLAQRSASAAKEIKTLITDSVEKISDGTGLVNATGTTFEEIVNSVERVHRIVEEISGTSQEQATNIDQVNAAVRQIDETTQQNAAMAEETTAASEHLSEQAATMEHLVSTFKTAGAAGAPSPDGGAVDRARPGARSVGRRGARL